MNDKKKMDEGAVATKHEAPSSSLMSGCSNYNTNAPDSQAEAPIVQFSVITNTASHLTKEFAYDDLGELRKISYAGLYEGAIKTETHSLAALKGLLAGLTTHQALLLGVPKPAYSNARRITVTKDKRVGTGGFIARSQEFIDWPDGPRLVLLDVDQFGGTRDEMEKALSQILSELESAAHFTRPSVSTCIKDAEGTIIRPENKWSSRPRS
jgi:hypothetical protein